MRSPIYARLLGPAWHDLDETLRRGRCGDSGVFGRGVFRVDRGGRLLGRVAGWLLGLPPAAERVAVELRVEPTAWGERWERRFGSRPLVTTVREVAGGLLAERWGILEFHFRLTPLGGAMEHRQERAGLRLGRLWLPLPRWLAPRVWGREEPAGDGAAAHVLVRVEVPGVGELLRYEGRSRRRLAVGRRSGPIRGGVRTGASVMVGVNRARYGVFALIALALPATVESGTGTEPVAEPLSHADAGALVARARRVQERDLEAWHRFAFRRRVVRRRLDAEGEVGFRQVLDFRVEPTADGFEETLVAIDGREPTAREVREHRRAGRFSGHYESAREGKLGGVLGVGELDFGYLLRALHYRYLGRESADGVACHHLAIEPVADGSDGDDDDPLAAATSGELWLAVDGLHVVRARTRLTRPVRQGLVVVDRLELDFTGQSVAGAWLPRRIELRSAVGGLLKVRAHNTYTYSGLEPRPLSPPPEPRP